MMNAVWIPSTPVQEAIEVSHDPFSSLPRLSRAEFAASRARPAGERRLQLPDFVETFCWENVRPQLPLQLSMPDTAVAWRGRHCRSYYHWLPTDCPEIGNWDEFDLMLRLFDFSPWRAYLAQRFRSQYGPPPFDPVSVGLGM